MKNILYIFTFLIFTNLQSEEVFDLNESKLIDVKLYRNNAELYHEVELNLKTGLNDYYISNIAKSVLENTIIAGADKGAMVYSVEYIRTYNDERITQKLKDSLDETIDLIQLNQMYVTKKDIEISVYESVPKNIAVAGNKYSALEIKNYSKLISTELESLFKDKIEINNKIKELNNLKSEQQKRLLELASKANKNLIKVSINSDVNVKSKLGIYYITNNVGWNPNYDIFLDKIDANARLQSKADIYQKSGIDWKNVNLTLNDGVQSYTTKPNIYPWELYYQKRVKNNYSKLQVMSRASSESANESDLGGFSDKITFAEMEVERIENYTGMEYIIPQKVTIENLTQHKQIKYKQDTVELNVYHLAVPKVNNSVFIIAEIKDFQKFRLNEGEITTYLEGIYKGKTYLSIPEKGLPEISFGEDKNIQIKRVNLEQFSESRFLSSKKETKFKYLITITNNKSQKINFKLQDHLPNLKSDDFSLEVINISKAKKDNDGILTWEFEIEPKQTVEKLLEFNLKHPEDFIIRD